MTTGRTGPSFASMGAMLGEQQDPASALTVTLGTEAIIVKELNTKLTA